MEIQDLLIENNIDKNIMIKEEKKREINKLTTIKEQNILLLKRMKHINELFEHTLDSLVLEINKKNEEIEEINKKFLENNKHLKYILSNIAKF